MRSRRVGIASRVGFALLAIPLALGVVAVILARLQGADPKTLSLYRGATITVDERGIPTIEASDWGALVEAQGYVVASERLWQMDLIRRKAGGRLAEWFGELAFDHDVSVQTEGRRDVVEKAVAKMPSDERLGCDRYAAGVNAFIGDHAWRWGLEYLILRTRPEPWTCGDSLLVLMEMADVLTGAAAQEAQHESWLRNLGPAWQAFLFPRAHAWNKPIVGSADGLGPKVPDLNEHLPHEPPKKQQASTDVDEPVAYGSNNWAWSGKDAAFLANDPHLSYSVPGIWYAMRLRLSSESWVVGVTIPGMPGIVVGMNPHVAWAFTNTGEDVDDDLLEVLSSDGTKYLVARGEHGDVWEPVERRHYEIRVKGEKEPRRLEVRATRRGPLVQRKYLGANWYSRQWLALQPEVLRLPMHRFADVRTLEQFDAALDNFRIPAQNVVGMDREGNFLYRTSGTGIERRSGSPTGRPGIGVDDAWLGLLSQDTRPRRFWKRQDGAAEPMYAGTANSRIWVDDRDHQWYSDDRADRIARYIAAPKSFSKADMQALQRDTEGRFRRMLLVWIADHAGEVSGDAASLVAKWRAWDGTSLGDPRIFAQSTLVEREMVALLTGRLQSRFPEADRATPYHAWDRRAWLLELIAPTHTYEFEPLAAFGLRARETAQYLLNAVVEADATLVPHHIANRWIGQHPFVKGIPVIGTLFRIDEPPQWGSFDLVRAEQPNFGPSMRLVWALRDPAQSTWSFPVGQSGHVASTHYHDFQAAWAKGEAWPVFADGKAWGF